MTIARIHVFSSASVAAPSPGFPAGGWNATFLPSCKGSCFASASLRALGSRENGIAGEGPTDPRAGNVIETPRLLGGRVGVAGTDGEGGEGARGRFLFSKLSMGVKRANMNCHDTIPGRSASEAFLRAIRMPSCSMASSMALWEEIRRGSFAVGSQGTAYLISSSAVFCTPWRPADSFL